MCDCGEMEVEIIDRFKTFTVLIDKLKRSIRKIKTAEMSEYELKSPHVSCLYYLYSSEPMTSKELAEMCEEDKASVSRSIEYLEEQGYIVCETKKQKRYKAPLILTEKGIEVAKIISKKINRILYEASVGLPEEDRTVMYRSLAVICDNLQRICDDYNE